MQEVNVYVETTAKSPREQDAAFLYLLEMKTAKGTPVANMEEWQKTMKLLYGNPFEIHMKQEHEYRKWMEREIRKETQYV